LERFRSYFLTALFKNKSLKRISGMMLDYQSLLLALGVSAACLMVTLLGTWLSRRSDSFLLTLVASLCLVVGGIVAYSSYTAQSGMVPAVIAYTFLMAGFSTIYAASVQFRTGEKPWHLAGGIFVSCLALGLPLFLAGLDGLGLIMMNILTALLLIGTAGQYWTARAEAPGPLGGMVLLYAVSGLSFALCASVLLADGEMTLGRAPANWAENLNIGICIAGMTGIGALSLALHQWRMAALHRREAMTDALTGLLNRRALFAQYGARRFGASTAVIVFDIDRFKAINDQYGHSAGDEVLRLFASDMLAEVTAAACVARLGGEEFAMIVSEIMPGRAERIANEIRKRFAARDILADGAILRCTVSAGVAVGLPEGQPFETVLSLADSALYEAKRSGRDRVELASYLRSIPAVPETRTSA
jgi:diguanylate cyclase (GGDEF)-like protein